MMIPRLNWPNTGWPEEPFPFNRNALFDDFFNANDAFSEQLRDYVASFENILFEQLADDINWFENQFDSADLFLIEQLSDYFVSFVNILQEQSTDDINWFNNQEIIKRLNDFGHWLGQNLPTPYDIDPDANNFFVNALRWVLRRDPLTLDLDGDGLETVGIDPNAPFCSTTTATE
jgi:hypothetical protein